MFNATSPYSLKIPTDYSAYGEKSPMIPLGSSLSVMGALLLIARERFRGPVDASIPYVWTRDDSKHADDFIEDTAKSNITIEIANKDENVHKDKRPAIFVDRGSISTNKLIIGDEIAQRRNVGIEMKYTLVNAPFRYVCRAPNRGAAEVLGNIMFEWLLYNAVIIRKHFQFHEIGPFSLNPEMFMQKQSDFYECTVDFRLAWDHRWANAPIAQKLGQITLTISEQDSGAVLEKIAISSLTKNNS
jgi:hypothetical protein